MSHKFSSPCANLKVWSRCPQPLHPLSIPLHSAEAMSRAALWKAEQLQAAQPNLPPPLPESISAKALPIHGNQTTFNVNSLLANNIMSCDYFRALYPLQTYHEVIDEIYLKCTNVEPWATGTSRVPSTAFCLLFK